MFNKYGDLAEGDSYKLPRQSCGVCYWGGGGEADMSGAMGISADARLQAVHGLENYYREAAEYLAPWRRAGGTALNQIGGLLKLPGYTALDPTATLEGTPGYQFLRDQGTEALRRYGAGTGLLSSGPGMKGALDYGQKLAQTYAWQPYMSSLQNLSGQGLGAAGTSGGYAMQAGMGTANIHSTMGQQQAQMAQQQAIMDAQNQNSWMNDLMSGLGFGTKLLLGSNLGGDVSDWFSSFGGTGNTVGALDSMPGMSLPQLYSGYSGSNQAFAPSSGGGWIPFMADGGPVASARPYVVGERGPELFIPNMSGYIVPNEYTRYSAFGGRR